MIVDRLRQYREKRNHERFLRENTWQGLVPGDVVDYKGKQLLYAGMNPHGGPGMADEPDPLFTSANPKEANIVYYVRTITGSLGLMPMPTAFLETAEPVYAGGQGRYIAFLNPKAGELKKDRHISAEDWNRMIAEVQAKLKGKAD